MKNRSVIVLLSGGIDSAALVNYYLDEGYKVYGLHLQHGQYSGESERLSAIKIAEYYKINLKIEKLGFQINRRKYELICRNALFVLVAASMLPENIGMIAIGIHSGCDYYDSTGNFIDDCQCLLDGYFHGTVNIDAPFINFTKEEIYDYCIDKSVPIHLTYSCETMNNTPCGSCPSCIDRRLLSNELK